MNVYPAGGSKPGTQPASPPQQHDYLTAYETVSASGLSGHVVRHRPQTDITGYEAAQIQASIVRNGRFLPLSSDLPENKFREEALRQLDTWFHVQTEVSGIHPRRTQKLRIDAVLRPRDTAPWYDPDPAFALEFKRSKTSYEHLSKYTRWIAQSMDYAETDWDGYGYLTVFTCPSVLSSMPYLDDRTEFVLSRVMGQRDVGELGFTREGWVLRLTGENYWTQDDGIVCDQDRRPRTLIPQTGSSR